MEVVQAPGHTRPEGESTPSQILTSKEVAQSTYTSIQIGDILTEIDPSLKCGVSKILKRYRVELMGNRKIKDNSLKSSHKKLSSDIIMTTIMSRLDVFQNAIFLNLKNRVLKVNF